MKPVKSSDTPSVISTSNLPPKSPRPPALTRTGKTDKLPRVSNRKTKIESDEDSSSSSPREPSVISSHTNPRSSRQTVKKSILTSTSLTLFTVMENQKINLNVGRCTKKERASIGITQKRLTGIKELPIKITQKRSSSLA